MKNANPVWRRLVLLSLLVLLPLAGCGDSGSAPIKATKPATEYFPIRVGQATVQLQLAVTDEEMERGLMHRTDLRGNQGMLFVYREPRKLSFWMRNTPTPLDIGFFTSDGVLREVYPLYPFDERSVASRREDLQYAMEVSQGWFDFTGVKPGDRIDLDAVRQALQARGFNPRDFR